MKTTLQYLDAVAGATGATSDYQLAKILKITRSAVSRYRCQQTTFDDVIAVRIAEIIGVEPLEVIASANHQRAKRPEQKAIWERIAKSAAAAAIALVFMVFSFSGGSATKAATDPFFDAGNIHYTKWRRLLRRVFGLAFSTMKGFMAMVFAASITACGSQAPAADNNHGYGYSFDAITASGLRIRYTAGTPTILSLGTADSRAALAAADFSTAEACTQLKGPPPLIIVVTNGTTSPHDGMSFFDTDTILIQDAGTMPIFEWALRHEFIHELLAANNFPADQNAAHASPLFTTCALY